MLKKICGELGVEIEEGWLASDGFKYKIDEYGQVWEWDDGHEGWIKSYLNLGDIIVREVRPRWKPEYDGEYYYPNPGYSSDYDRCDLGFWRSSDDDMWRLENNMVFKTREEAIERSNQMIRMWKEG